MRVLISGSSGLIGSALSRSFTERGYEVVRLVRRAPSGGDILWNPDRGELALDPKSQFDVVLHLAGENIGAGRWSAARKERILSSRVNGTRTLVSALTQLQTAPPILISASAVGFYGDRGDEIVREENRPGDGFLAEVCKQWEAEALKTRQHGIRTVCLRIGVVLARDGGALAKMLLPFKLGLGGKFGDGSQYMSWVALDDLVAAVHHVVYDDSISGPVNVVAPHPVTNAEFTKTLGKVLRRPTILGAPAFALKLLLGEMAGPLLLEGQRVEPSKLLATRFEFKHPELDTALRSALGR
jgi:uncharacterized protein